MPTINAPLGTEKGHIIGLNGLPYVLCDGDTPYCINEQLRPLSYFDAAGTQVFDKCDATYVELGARNVCCGHYMNALVPDAVAALPAGSRVFTTEYANDGTAFPDLAAAGTIFVGTISGRGCGTPLSRWDRTSKAAPAGYQYIEINVASANEAAAAAA